jgi:hypothetical protein
MTVEERKLHSLDLNSYQHGVHNTREKDANQLVNAKFQPYANRLQQQYLDNSLSLKPNLIVEQQKQQLQQSQRNQLAAMAAPVNLSVDWRAYSEAPAGVSTGLNNVSVRSKRVSMDSVGAIFNSPLKERPFIQDEVRASINPISARNYSNYHNY